MSGTSKFQIAKNLAIGVATALVVHLVGGLFVGMTLGILTAMQWIDVHPHQQRALFNVAAFWTLFVSVGAGLAAGWLYARRSIDRVDG